MNDIRILFYTDFSYMVSPGSGWSITRLMKMVSLKSKGLANVSFTLVDRRNGLQKLDCDRLKDFDELWVFGFIELKKPPFSLEEEEITALSEWMTQGGGVLVTGDHSITRAANECDADHKTFFGHGRAIGSCIPLAGLMRDWEGPPTACDNVDLVCRDNFNTQEGDDPDTLDSLLLQLDSKPQILLKEKTTHPLFSLHLPHDPAARIRKFPDHQHEGRLIPKEELQNVWPKGFPLPEIVARGIDKRFPEKPRIYDLVSAFDGARAGVGRIVADSSFHHYIDTNLNGLEALNCCGEPIPGSDLDQIAQYFWNLVLWLAPSDLRKTMKLSLLVRAALLPEVLEIWGTGAQQLAETGRRALQADVGLSNLFLLFSRSAEEEENFLDEFFKWIIFEQSSDKFEGLNPNLILGYTIKAVHLFMERNEFYDPAWIRELPRPEVFIREGMELSGSKLPESEAILSKLQETLSSQF